MGGRKGIGTRTLTEQRKPIALRHGDQGIKGEGRNSACGTVSEKGEGG